MKTEFRSTCPIASSLDVIGDKWSLLIIRDMLIHHKKTFKDLSNSDERIAPSILSARLKLLAKYKLITKRKLAQNKKENIYLLSEKAIGFTSIIIEFSLWGNKYLREFNEIDTIEGLQADKSLIIKAIQNKYCSMLDQVISR